VRVSVWNVFRFKSKTEEEYWREGGNIVWSLRKFFFTLKFLSSKFWLLLGAACSFWGMEGVVFFSISFAFWTAPFSRESLLSAVCVCVRFSGPLISFFFFPGVLLSCWLAGYVCVSYTALYIWYCTHSHIALAGGIFTASLDGCPGVGPPSAKQQFVRVPKRPLSLSSSLSTNVLLL
jgi:hypothetical protein